jgi:hypothetical protein
VPFNITKSFFCSRITMKISSKYYNHVIILLS